MPDTELSPEVVAQLDAIFGPGAAAQLTGTQQMASIDPRGTPPIGAPDRAPVTAPPAPDQGQDGPTPPDAPPDAPAPVQSPPQAQPTVAPTQPSRPVQMAANAQPQIALPPLVAPSPAVAGKPPSGMPGYLDPNYTTRVTASESSNDPNAKNPNSTAGGRYQITDGTFRDLQMRHPDHQYADKNDPQAFQDLTNDNSQVLRLGLGRQPNSMDVFTAHFLGAAGAVKFIKAADADPNTSVTEVVSPDQLAANKNIFYDPKTGQAYSVGQVYNSYATKMGFRDSPLLPGVRPPTTDPASATGVQAPTQSPGDLLYGQHKIDIENYIRGQPEMWSKLADLQQKFHQQTQPTFLDRIGDALNSFQQQQAAIGGRATAGGVLNHELPSGEAFGKSLQSSHQMDMDARAARAASAQQDYQMQSGALQAQNQQAASNLNMTGALAKDTGEYNLAAQKNQLEAGHNQTEATHVAQEFQLGQERNQIDAGKIRVEMAKFGLDQQKAIADEITKIAPNEATAARITELFYQRGDPNASYDVNKRLLSSIATEVQAGTPAQPGAITPASPGNPELNQPATAASRGPDIPAIPGMQLTKKEPGDFVTAVYMDENGQEQHVPINRATLEGQAQQKQLVQNYHATIIDPKTPQSTINNNMAGGSEDKSPTPLADQRGAAIETRNAAQAAKALLPYIIAHGGTGTLTDGDSQSAALIKNIRQLTGYDPTGEAARTVYDKLMESVQTGLTLPQLKSFGSRPAAAENALLRKATLGSTAHQQAASYFLDHVIQSMDWNARRLKELSDAQVEATNNGRKLANIDNWMIHWEEKPGNYRPAWNHHDDLERLTAAPDQEATSSPASRQPASSSTPASRPKVVGETRTLEDGSRWKWNGTKWDLQ